MANQTVRGRLAEALNAELERLKMPYRVDPEQIGRIRAGSADRAAGAGSWFAIGERTDGAASPLSIISWNTMAECARGLELSKGVVDWEANPVHGQ